MKISPVELAGKALRIPGNLGVAYTYNEPTVFYEFMFETAVEVKQTGLKNVMVSNGFIHSGPLEKLLPYMDAFNIDLKSFSDDFYRKMTGGRLTPILESLKTIRKAGKHLEITFLVIPGLNDSTEEFDRMTGWIFNELGPDVPFHLSRYFPAYRLSVPPTPHQTLNRLATAAAQKLRYVFTGNVSNEDFSSTFCPYCQAELIHRIGYDIRVTGLSAEGTCRGCGAKIPVIV